jgi:Spy/CpxP family protein refolding chaperone
MDNAEKPTTRKGSWRRRGLVALGIAGAVAAAAGIAWAAGVGPGGFGHGFCKPGMAKDFMEFRIHKALQQVDASPAQERQIMAIVDGLAAKHQAMAAERTALHQKIAAALTGPTVDRAALEAVRVEVMQRLDEGSKDLAKAVGDIAEVLTPAQRQQLAELHRQHFE